MRRSNISVSLAVLLSFLFAFILMIIPISPAFKWLRPDLVSLVLIYWVANLPSRVGIYYAFGIGLLFDLLTGMLFGSMGLTLALVAFLAMNLRLRLRIYRPWQKFVVIMLIVACAQLIRLWIQMVVGHTPGSFTYWLASVTSAFAWPLVYMSLSHYQRTLSLR